MLLSCVYATKLSPTPKNLPTLSATSTISSPSNVSFKVAFCVSSSSSHAIAFPFVEGYIAKPLGSIISASISSTGDCSNIFKSSLLIRLFPPSPSDDHTTTSSYIEGGQVPYVGLENTSKVVSSSLSKL